MTRHLATIPAHPVLLAAWLVFSVQIDTGVHAAATPRVWLVVLVATVGLIAVWMVLTRDRHVAGLAASASVWLLATPELGRLWLGVVLVAALGAALIVARRIAGARMTLAGVTRGLNLTGVLLIVVTAVQGVTNGVLPALLTDTRPASVEVDGGGSAELPDIYLVLLDGYPRADILEDVSGMDNTPFLTALTDRGFAVADDSHSSYMYSDLTAISLFYGVHLVDIPELQPLLEGQDRPALARQVLNQAPLVDLLRDQGYVAVANAQAWDEPALRTVDSYVEGDGWNEFERRMWWNSLPGSLWQLQGFVVFQDALEPWVHSAFSAFRKSAATNVDRPQFSFIHVPSPHLPIIFEADGSRADPAFGRDHPAQIAAPRTEVEEAYAGQIEYLNRQVLDILDHGGLEDDAIVILMSDHGPEFGLDWFDGGRTDLRTRFGAFLAVRGAPDVIQRTSNVSGVLAEVLRTLGLADPPPLEDRYFISDAFTKMATLEEVADPYAGAPAR